MRWCLFAIVLAACGGRGFYPAAPPGGPAVAQCTGGAVPSGDQCVCPEGTQWVSTECVAVSPETEPPASAETNPDCPADTVWDGQQCTPSQPAQPPATDDGPQPTVTITETHVAPPPDPGPPANPVWHASFETQAGSGSFQCQAFDTGDRGDLQAPDMVQCSQWCTGYLAGGMKCQCDQGPC